MRFIAGRLSGGSVRVINRSSSRCAAAAAFCARSSSAPTASSERVCARRRYTRETFHSGSGSVGSASLALVYAAMASGHRVSAKATLPSSVCARASPGRSASAFSACARALSSLPRRNSQRARAYTSE